MGGAVGAVILMGKRLKRERVERSTFLDICRIRAVHHPVLGKVHLGLRERNSSCREVVGDNREAASGIVKDLEPLETEWVPLS